MVRALGYTDADVAALGAWPTGHIAKATELGLLVGVTGFNKDANANRGSIALLLENMVFDAPAKDGKTLAQSVFGLTNIASIVVTPATATASIGELKEFAAVGKDATGATVALEGVVWTVTGNAIIGQDGKFTAYGSGPCVVKATVGEISGTASVRVAGAPAAVKLTLAASPFVANTETTTDLTVEIVDVAGVTVPTAETVVNLIISGNGRFVTGGGKDTTTQVTTAEGMSVVKVVSADGVYADGAGNITATTVPGITGAILPYTMVKPTVTTVGLRAEASVIEAKAGAGTLVVAEVLDSYGVKVPAPVGFNLRLTSSDTTIGTIADMTILETNDGSDTVFTATAVPGSATITGVAMKISDGSDTGYTVTPVTIRTAIAGDAYRLVLKPVTAKTASWDTFRVSVEVQDYNGVVKTEYVPNMAHFTLTAKHGGTTLTFAGAHSFDYGVLGWDIDLQEAGDWALEATHTGSLLKATGSVAINPAAAAGIYLEPIEPDVLTANGAQQAKLTVKIVDTFGNLVPTATHEVTFIREAGSDNVTQLPASMKASAVGGVATLWITAGTGVGTDTFSAKVVRAAGDWSYGSEDVHQRIVGLPNKLYAEMGDSVQAGKEYTVTVHVEDATGTLVSTNQGTAVTLSLEAGSVAGAVIVNPTVTAVNGKATFKITSTKVGDIFVKAVSAGLLENKNSQVGAFTVGPAARIKVTPALSAMETGTTGVALALSAVDAHGNTVPGAVIGNVVLQTTLGALTPTNTTFAAGTAVGSAVITDTDGVGNVAGVTGNLPVEGCTITLYNAGPAHKLAIKPLTATVVCATWGHEPDPYTRGMVVDVEIQDSEGRVKTTMTSHILLQASPPYDAIYDSAGVWAGPGRNAVNGSVRFYVMHYQAGNMTFTATSLGLATATASGTYIHDVPKYVNLEVNPDYIRADGSSITQLTAEVQDRFGNVVPNYSGTMKWTIPDTGHQTFATLLSANTAIINGVAHNTLQSKARDLQEWVEVRAEVLGVPELDCDYEYVRVDGVVLVIDSVSLTYNGTHFVAAFSNNRQCYVELTLRRPDGSEQGTASWTPLTGSHQHDFAVAVPALGTWTLTIRAWTDLYETTVTATCEITPP